MQQLSREIEIVPQHAALLFVDVQNYNATAAGGEFASMPADQVQREYGWFFETLRTSAVPNMQRLQKACRARGIEVLYTVIESATRDGRDRSLDHKLSHILVPKGDPEGAIIDALAPTENEIVLPKSSSGVFNSTNIDYILRNLGVRFLIVAGIVTDQCVDMAVRDAADRGYFVSLLEDGCAAYTDERHQSALRVLSGYSWLTDTATVVRRIEAMTAKPGVMA